MNHSKKLSKRDLAWLIYVDLPELDHSVKHSITIWRMLDELSPSELEAITALALDGWNQSLEDLFSAAKELA